MRSLALLPAALLAAAPAGAATRSFIVTGFDRVRVVAPVAVTLRVGPAGSAKAEGAAGDLDRLRLDVQGRTLTVGLTRSSGERQLGAVRVLLATPALAGASVTGAGSLAVDRAKAQRLDLAVAGAGSLDVGGIAADRLVASALGSGKLTLAGRAADARIAVQGSAAVAGEGLVAADADVSLTGSGAVTLTATRTATVAATGAGNVTVLGRPACKVRQTGAAEVRCGE